MCCVGVTDCTLAGKTGSYTVVGIFMGYCSWVLKLGSILADGAEASRRATSDTLFVHTEVPLFWYVSARVSSIAM